MENLLGEWEEFPLGEKVYMLKKYLGEMLKYETVLYVYSPC